MPLGAFRLNGIAKHFSPGGPVVTGWNAYTGAEDGALHSFSDTTYGIGGIHADLITPNKILFVTSGNNNIANQNRVYEITWDSNYNITRTFKHAIDVPNIRSSGNYINYNQLVKFYVNRLHLDPAQSGFASMSACQEGTGGGNQRLNYAFYTTNGSGNVITTKTIGFGTFNGGFLAFRQIPSYATDSTYVYIGNTQGGGGGSNNTNYIGSMRFNKSTGEGDFAYDTIDNDGRGSQNDGNRHPIPLTSTLDASNFADPIILTFQGVIQNAATPGVEFNALSITNYPAATEIFRSTIVEMPDSERNIPWHSHYNFDKPGYQLFSIGRTNPDQRFALVKANENGTNSPNFSFSSLTSLPYVFDGYANTRNWTTNLTDDQGIVFFLNDNGTNNTVKMCALNINYNTLTLDTETDPFDITTQQSGVGKDLTSVIIDDNTIFVSWCDTVDNVYAKIIRKA